MSKRSEELKAALIKAKEAAMQFINNEDGGTCNFDAPTVFLKGWRKAEVEAACEGAGLRCWKYKSYGSSAYVICGGTSGQGNRRTTMAEEMYRTIKAAGFDAGMYYQMD